MYFFNAFRSHHRKAAWKFVLLLVVLLAYFGYLSFEYGIASGGLVSLLTWSFFVLCTPIADAGALVDFPVRIIAGIRMWISELFVWGTAISTNLVAMNFAENEYHKTYLTRLLHQILTHPYPYGVIIALSAVGTFLSIFFGDEVFDAVSGKTSIKNPALWAKLGAFLLVFAVTIYVYYHLLDRLGVHLPN